MTEEALNQIRCPICDVEMKTKQGWYGHTRNKNHRLFLAEQGLTSVDPEEINQEPEPDVDVMMRDYEARIAELEREIERTRPEVKHVILTEQNIVDVLGRKYLEEKAELQLVKQARSRRAENRPELWKNQAEFEDLRNEEMLRMQVELVERQTSFANWEPGTTATRTLKMSRPVSVRKPDGPRMLVQLPVEDQVNNGAAAPGQGVNIYPFRDRKGFKLLTPHLCEVKDCWAEARVPQGSEKFCSEEHASMIPKALDKNRSVAITPSAARKGYVSAP